MDSSVQNALTDQKCLHSVLSGTRLETTECFVSFSSLFSQPLRFPSTLIHKVNNCTRKPK